MGFTFKTEKATGPYSSFFPDHHYIKIKRKEVGSIGDGKPYPIRLMVVKKDINEDKNPNRKWRIIRLKKESKTLDEAKKFLNDHFDSITKRYELYRMEE